MRHADLLRLPRGTVTLLLVTLALVGQLVLGTRIAGAGAGADAGAGSMVDRVEAMSLLCSGPDAGGHPTHHRHQAPSDCLIVAAADLPPLLLAPDVMLPGRLLAAQARPGPHPPARAPPDRGPAFFQPRGPPGPT